MITLLNTGLAIATAVILVVHYKYRSTPFGVRVAILLLCLAYLALCIVNLAVCNCGA